MMRKVGMGVVMLVALLFSACAGTNDNNTTHGGIAPSATATPTATLPPTATNAPTATPSQGLIPDGPDWQRWHDAMGYSVSVPAALQYFPGQDDPSLNGHSFISKAGQPFVQMDIQAINKASYRLCTEGTPTTVGKGIAAREIDQLTPPAGGASAPIFFRVEFVASGLDITFTFRTTLSASAMQAQYGGTWRTILGSFVAGPTMGQVQPCP